MLPGLGFPLELGGYKDKVVLHAGLLDDALDVSGVGFQPASGASRVWVYFRGRDARGGRLEACPTRWCRGVARYYGTGQKGGEQEGCDGSGGGFARRFGRSLRFARQLPLETKRGEHQVNEDKGHNDA